MLEEKSILSNVNKIYNRKRQLDITDDNTDDENASKKQKNNISSRDVASIQDQYDIYLQNLYEDSCVEKKPEPKQTNPIQKYGKMQEINKEILTCWSCKNAYDSDRRKRTEMNCNHYVCGQCMVDTNHTPCQMCVNIFVMDEDEPVQEEPADPVEWLYEGIIDSTDEFSKINVYAEVIESTLVNVFKLEKLRPIQLAGINAAMLKQDCFVIMPSGGGKSLVFQLPAYISTGVTIVISPLISLIHDQCEYLSSINVRAVNNLGTSKEMRVIEEDIYKVSPTTKLFYTTPERAFTEAFKKMCLQLKRRNNLTRIVIDEAHCAFQWGTDFRFSYLKMKSFLNTICDGIPVTLCTASVRPDSLFDTLEICGLATQKRRPDVKYFLASCNRPNLVYSSECVNLSTRLEKVVDIVTSAQFKNCCGIVYCVSKSTCRSLQTKLQEAEVGCVVYNADLSHAERMRNQTAWMRNEWHARVMIATIAFGLGINKKDVRFVVHCGLPKSVEGYYQESGRAGRDGKIAFCTLLWSPYDSSAWENTFTKSKENSNPMYAERNARTLKRQVDELQAVQNFAETKKCRRYEMLRYLGEDYSSSSCKGKMLTYCDNCINK